MINNNLAPDFSLGEKSDYFLHGCARFAAFEKIQRHKPMRSEPLWGGGQRLPLWELALWVPGLFRKLFFQKIFWGDKRPLCQKKDCLEKGWVRVPWRSQATESSSGKSQAAKWNHITQSSHALPEALPPGALPKKSHASSPKKSLASSCKSGNFFLILKPGNFCMVF